MRRLPPIAIALVLVPAVVALGPKKASGPAEAALDRKGLAARVREETLSAWRAYEADAWGHDELKPVSKTAKDWYGAGQSLLMTPVDSLDTLLLMGLNEQAERAKSVILEKLSFDRDIFVKNFEITIRLLGGLLSGYQMTGDERLLRLADDLGTRLLPVFGSPTGMPYVYVNLKTGKTKDPKSNPAEIGTLILEFGTLSKLTGKPAYFEKAKKALAAVYERRSKIGLVGEEIDVETGQWTNRASHIGGAIDSYYEYLVKCAVLYGDADCVNMSRESIKGVNERLAEEAPSGFWYGQADLETGVRTASEFGALHAFFPAVLALSGDLPRAKRLQDSCFKMWNLHGIEPEVLDYRTMKVVSPGYQLRPEIMESAYYLYRYTKDPRYLEMGRTFLEGLEKHCRAGSAFTTLKDVTTKEKGDLMPSYFLAESLKYLYLIFAPEKGSDTERGGSGGAVDLDRVVFTTEAHPIRRTW